LKADYVAVHVLEDSKKVYLLANAGLPELSANATATATAEAC
jgi:hypothetical protein